MNDDAVLLFDMREGVATLTLNRPEKMNALNYALRRRLSDALDAIAADAEIGAVVLTGAGRAFCAGLDLTEMANPDSGGPLLDPPAQMRALPQPVIGAVNGVAVTGGFELATSCDVLIGSDRARFADTHARLGLIAGWGLSQRLPRMIGINRAKELAFTGNYLSAEQAYEWGLLNRVVPADDLLPTAHALARDMVSCDQDTVRTCKRLIEDGFALPLGEAMALEAEVNSGRRAQPGEIAERREAVLRRGREQAG